MRDRPSDLISVGLMLGGSMGGLIGWPLYQEPVAGLLTGLVCGFVVAGIVYMIRN